MGSSRCSAATARSTASTCRVKTGTVYGVLGPNGAGKTTTISMLATLLRPDGGSARIFGHDVVHGAADRPAAHRRDRPVRLRRRDAVGHREPRALRAPPRTLPRRVAARRPRELLEQFALTEAAKRPLKNFSGGMRRRLDLAASLIAQPPLIFLDEPTTGPRPAHPRADVGHDPRLVATGSTVLLTTQYLDEADQLADRIAVIDRGKVVAEGTARRAQGFRRRSLSLQLRLADAADLAEARGSSSNACSASRRSLSPEAARLTAPMRDPDRVADLLVALRDAEHRV